MATQYRKVNKTVARKAFNDNKTVVICAHKLYPFGGWAPGYHANKSNQTAPCGNPVSFDYIVDEYKLYNCTYETGYYPAYYIAN